MWTLAFGHYQPCTAYAAKREATMTAFAKSWRGRSKNFLALSAKKPNKTEFANPLIRIKKTTPLIRRIA
jgi:hypothetical protein